MYCKKKGKKWMQNISVRTSFLAECPHTSIYMIITNFTANWKVKKIRQTNKKKDLFILIHDKTVARRYDRYHLTKNSIYFLNMNVTFEKGGHLKGLHGRGPD